MAYEELFSAEDYLQGRVKTDTIQQVNDNFIQMICRLNALCDVLGMTPHEKELYEAKAMEYFQEAIRKVREIRKNPES